MVELAEVKLVRVDQRKVYNVFFGLKKANVLLNEERENEEVVSQWRNNSLTWQLVFLPIQLLD